MKIRGTLEGFRSHRLEVYDMGMQTLTNALVKIDLFREGKLHYTDPEMLGVVIELEKAILCMHELFLDSLSHVDKKYSYDDLCTKINEEAQWVAEDETTIAPIDKNKAKITIDRLFKYLKRHLKEQSEPLPKSVTKPITKRRSNDLSMEALARQASKEGRILPDEPGEED